MRIKLKAKIWFTILTIVLMFSFFSLYYFPAQQEKYLLDSYNNEVQNLANTISLGVKIALRDEDYEGMTTAMEFVAGDPRLLYVSLIVTDTILDKNTNQYILKDTVLKTVPENAVVNDSINPPNSVIKKRSPYVSRSLSGAVELVVTTKNIEMSKRKIRVTSLIVSGIVFIIGMLIGFWLSRSISIPVLALRNAADRVGEGDLTQQVMNTSGDEIGELTRSFNKMVADLAKAREEIRNANLNLAATNETLHNTVADLKAAQELLIQAEKMASLGQLTAGIAHEINNPINFVTANIQPLKDDMTDIMSVISRYEKVISEKGLDREFEEVNQFKQVAKIDFTMKEMNDLLKGIEDGAMRTSEIVKGLRNFSRLDQNIFRKANLNESLESTLTLLHSSFKNRIEVIKQYGSLPEVDCFPGQINQVFMNILSNAIQAVPAEGSIFIKTWQVNDMVKVSIRDTGAGMTEMVRKKIFDPFFTTKDVGKGTGLGLSISFGIIQKHFGKIEVLSEPGEGTEFIISIPITQKTTV